LGIFHLKKIQSDTFSQDNIMAYNSLLKQLWAGTQVVPRIYVSLIMIALSRQYCVLTGELV